jgi:membrane protein
MLGAAMAYYAIFSMAPLLILALALAGMLLGGESGPAIYNVVSQYVGPKTTAVIQSMVHAATSRPRPSLISTGLGMLTLIIGGMVVFSQLREALNIIWRVEADPRGGFWRPLLRQLLAFVLTALIAALLFISLLVSTIIPALGTLLTQAAIPGGEQIWRMVDILASLLIFGTAFSAVFLVLPDVKLSWRQAAVGGIVSAVFFVIGKQLLGLYLGRSGISSAYGAAGSVVVLLLWVYYSSQIFLFGAELMRAFVIRRGVWPPAKPGARHTDVTIP